MKFRQARIPKKDMMATDAKLRIEGHWIPGKILDKNGKVMPFPCEIKAGEKYFVEADTDEKN